MTFKIVVKATSTAGATIEVTDEVRQNLEEAYEALRSNPGTEAHVGFYGTGVDAENFNPKIEAEMAAAVTEKSSFMKQAKVWSQTREAGLLTVRQLPSKHLPANEVRFTIAANLPANAAEGNGAQTNV